MKSQKNCPFCNFKDKKAIIYKDTACFAVISKNPINKFHVLVFPRRHYESFVNLPNKQASAIFLTAKKISLAVRKACKPDAITHISDDDISEKGYNLVRHYKLHIIPRFKNDGVKINWGKKTNPSIKVRSESAKIIKHCLGFRI